MLHRQTLQLQYYKRIQPHNSQEHLGNAGGFYIDVDDIESLRSEKLLCHPDRVTILCTKSGKEYYIVQELAELLEEILQVQRNNNAQHPN